MYIRKRLIRSMVERLIEHHKLHTLPIQIEKLAKNCNLEIHKDNVEDKVSGFLYREVRNKSAILGVNANHSETRQRFTIAHELGHFFLHAGDPVFVDQAFVMMRDTASSEGEKLEEREANLFAAELLMPAKLITKEVEGMDDIDIVEDGKIERLAKKFGVSIQAMSFRLANLGVSLA